MKYKKEQYIDQRYSEQTKTWSFRVRYNGVNKSFNEKDYLSAREAYEHAIKFRNSIYNGFEYVSCDVPIRDVLNESYEIFPIREQTIRKLDNLYDLYINLDKPVTMIKKTDILKSLNNLIETSTDDTISRVFSLWKRIFRTAIIKDYINKDLTLGIKAPKSHFIGGLKLDNRTDKETLDKMCSLCRKHFSSVYDREQFPLMIMFLYYTGCRPCEMFALNISDVKDYIDINKEMGSSLRDNNVVRQCKTPRSVRKIPITPELREIIDKAIKMSPNEILFPNRNGSYYNSTYVGDRLHNLGKRYGIDFHMYQIRHLFSTDLLIGGTDVKTIQSLMGHHNQITTIDYALSSEKLMKKALESRK